ncbi:MAG: PAS domain S-box protein [Rubrivivax sp.]|nr:PAS domain S-box protein [Rubrivivax sp.]
MVDLRAPLGIGAAFLYVPVIWALTLSSVSRRGVVMLTLVALGLSVIAALFPGKGGDILAGAVNRGLAMLGLGVMAFVGLRHREAIESLRQHEANLRDFIDNAPIAIHWVDAEGTILYANREELQMTGYAQEEYLGRKCKDFHVDPEGADCLLDDLTRDGTVREHVAQLRCKDGTVKDVRITSSVRFDNGRFVHSRCFTRDTTRELLSERALARANRVYAMLSQTNQLVVRTEDRQRLFEGVCHIAIDVGGFRFAWIGLLGTDQRLRRVAHAGVDSGYLSELERGLDTSELGASNPAVRALRDGVPTVSNDFLADVGLPSSRSAAGRAGFVTAAALPIRLGGEIIGVLKLYAHEPEAFGPQELDTLTEMVGDISFGLDSSARNRALRDSEQTLNGVLDTLHVGVWLVDAAGEIVMVNPAGGRIWAAASSTGVEQFGRVKAWRADGGAPIMAREWAGAQAIEKGEAKIDEVIEIECFDGTRKTVLNSAVPLRSDDGAIRGAIVVNHDITERQRADDALRKSEQRLRRAVDSAPLPILIHAEDGEIVTVNRTWTKVTGYTPSELPTIAAWTELAYGDRKEVARAEINRIFALEGAAVEGESELRTASGEHRVWNFTAATIGRMADGRRLAVSMALDVTEGRKAQQALAASESFMRATLDSLPASIAIIDQAGTIVAVNRGWREFAAENAGTSAGTCDGANYLDVCDRAVGDGEADGRAMAEGIRQLLAGKGDVVGFEYACHSPTQQRWFVGRVSRMVSAGPSRAVVVHFDVTKRRLAQDAARKLSQRLSHFLKLSPHINYALRIDGGRFVTEWVSDNIVRLLGYTVDQALQPEWWSTHLHPDDRQAALLLAKSALRDGDAQSEYRFGRADGSWFWVNDQMRIERDTDGSPLRIIGSWTDITERHAAQQALEQSESRFRSTFEQAAVGIAHISTAGHWIDFNERMCQVVGYARHELMMRTFKDITHPDDLDRDLGVMKQMLAGKFANYTLQKRYVHKDGHIVWIYRTVSLVRKADGDPDYFVSVVEDISELKRAEEQLHRLSQAVEQSSESIVITDADGCIEYVNEAFTRITGYERDEVIGANPRVLQSGKTPPEVYEAMWMELRAGRAWRGELQNRRKDGTEYLQAAVINPIRQADGRITHFVAAQEDITERKRNEAELEGYRQHLEELVRRRTAQLEQARALADAANQAKSAFLANMSHEIRTPMNGVLGMIEVLERSRLTEQQAEMVRTARDSGRTLLGIIDDILDFSKIEAGRMQIEVVPMSVAEVAEGVCDSLVPAAARQDLSLSVFVDPSIPERVFSDPLRLRQMLFNLIGNAIKFTGGKVERRGRVWLRVTVVQAAPLRLAFAVSDNGIGMTDEAVARLFTPFSQAEASTTRRFGGSGLGLTICRRLADLMDGEIAVRSRTGEGSTFTLTLPMDPLAEQPAQVLPELLGIHCLLSETPDLDIDGLTAYLQAAGARVHRVSDMDAGEQIAKGIVGPKVAIRYVGKLHPSSTESFRASNDMRYLFITNGRRRRARIESPQIVTLDGAALRRQALLRAVAVAAGRASPEVAPDIGGASGTAAVRVVVPTVAQARRRGDLILVAEDDAINRLVIIRQLELLGRAAEVACDGAEALRMWREGRYAMLLTDLHMPELDGYALTEAIRREEASRSGLARRMPIVALTANALRGEDERAKAVGMEDYVTKPLQLERLRKVLDRWLPPVDRNSTA